MATQSGPKAAAREGAERVQSSLIDAMNALREAADHDETRRIAYLSAVNVLDTVRLRCESPNPTTKQVTKLGAAFEDTALRLRAKLTADEPLQPPVHPDVFHDRTITEVKEELLRRVDAALRKSVDAGLRRHDGRMPWRKLDKALAQARPGGLPHHPCADAVALDILASLHEDWWSTKYSSLRRCRFLTNPSCASAGKRTAPRPLPRP